MMVVHIYAQDQDKSLALEIKHADISLAYIIMRKDSLKQVECGNLEFSIHSYID